MTKLVNHINTCKCVEETMFAFLSADSLLDIEGLSIDTVHVESAIRHTKPSAKTIIGQYEKWQQKYESS